MSTSTAIFNLFATEMGQFQVGIYIGAKIKTTEADIPSSNVDIHTTSRKFKIEFSCWIICKVIVG